MPKRKYRLGQKVQTKSGLVGKVIGSAYYPYLHGGSFSYRVKVAGKAKTMYRWEDELKKPTKKKGRR